MSDTITATMSRWAADLRYEDIGERAVQEARRYLLDSIGCALGGYQQEDVEIALDVLDEVAGPGPATVIGSGARFDVVSAALANALMVRVMDYNDIYWQQDPSHPSDIIPAAMACAERQGKGGRDLILGIVLGHEFEMRLCEAAFPGIRERGWHHGTLTAFVSPIVAGRMLDLPWEKIQHAIGISASHSGTFGAVTAGKLTMMKNTVDPMATEAGVMAALLAEKGYTGPEHVIDGKEGLVHCMGPEWKLEILTDGLGESWRIERCGMKYFPTEALTHAPISAVLQLVRRERPRSRGRREDPHSIAGPRRRHPGGSDEVRSAQQGNGGPQSALRDRGGPGRAQGHARAVRARDDHGPAHSRTASQGRGHRGSGDREGLSRARREWA